MTLKYMKLNENSSVTKDSILSSTVLIFIEDIELRKGDTHPIFIISNNRQGVTPWGFSSNEQLGMCVGFCPLSLRY